MWAGYQQDFVKVRSRRHYLACHGCSASWIWADRVNESRWGCNKCGTPWKPQETRTDSWSPTKKARKNRGRDRTKLEPPPGLGNRQKSEGNAIEAALRKAWATMPAETQEALKGAGIDLTPEPEIPPLEEVLKAHLESLPKEVKDVVAGLIKPAPAATVDVTGQLKATVGELRQLATKKQSLQRKVDQAKEQYRVLLDELKTVQEAIDKEHKQLGDQSAAYASS